MLVSPYDPSHREDVLRMRHALWPHESLEEHRAVLAVLAEGGSPVGFPGPATILVASPAEATPIVGFAEVAIRPWAEGCDEGPVGYLEGWWVEAQARRSGAGRALVDAAARWCREQGCLQMASDAELDNETSLAAHLALGFEERERLVILRLDLSGLEAQERFLDPQATARLDRIGGAKLVGKIHRLFLVRAPTLAETLIRSHAEADTELLERTAHSLKSSAANIGAERLRRLAEELERGAAAGDLAGAPRHIRGVQRALDEVLPEVLEVADSAGPPPG